MQEKLFISWIISIILFALSSLPFFVGFFFTVGWDILYFIVCLFIMILFAALYLKFDKKMKERKDCSKYEYIYFYKKCKLLIDSANRRRNEKEVVKQCASELAYFANIEEDLLIKIFHKGKKAYNKK